MALFNHLVASPSSWKNLKGLNDAFIDDFIGAIQFVNVNFLMEFADPYLMNGSLKKYKNAEHLLKLIQSTMHFD